MADVDLSQYTAAQVIAAISAAIRANDMPAVVSLLHVLAVKDPASAQLILDMVQMLAKEDSGA